MVKPWKGIPINKLTFCLLAALLPGAAQASDPDFDVGTSWDVFLVGERDPICIRVAGKPDDDWLQIKTSKPGVREWLNMEQIQLIRGRTSACPAPSSDKVKKVTRKSMHPVK